MTPSSDGLLSSILNDDDLQLMDPAMGADGKKIKTILKQKLLVSKMIDDVKNNYTCVELINEIGLI